MKLENILLDLNGDVKLGDFGCSVIDFKEESRSTFCGTVDCKWFSLSKYNVNIPMNH